MTALLVCAYFLISNHIEAANVIVESGYLEIYQDTAEKLQMFIKKHEANKPKPVPAPVPMQQCKTLNIFKLVIYFL